MLLRDMVRDHIAKDLTGRMSRRKRRVAPPNIGTRQFGYYLFSRWETGSASFKVLTEGSPELRSYAQSTDFMTVDDTQTTAGPLTVNKTGYYLVKMWHTFLVFVGDWENIFQFTSPDWEVNPDSEYLVWRVAIQSEDPKLPPGTWAEEFKVETGMREVWHTRQSFVKWGVLELIENHKLRLDREVITQVNIPASGLEFAETVIVSFKFLGDRLETSE